MKELVRCNECGDTFSLLENYATYLSENFSCSMITKNSIIIIKKIKKAKGFSPSIETQVFIAKIKY